MRFVHFTFTPDYMEYPNATSITDEGQVVNNSAKKVFVNMSCTEWFNLQLCDGRQAAICHILAILRRHDARTSDVGNENGHDEDGD